MFKHYNYTICLSIWLIGVSLLVGACGQSESTTRIQAFATLMPTAMPLSESVPTDESHIIEQATTTPSVNNDEPLFVVVNVDPDDVLNMRQGAGVAYPIVGTIPPFGSNVRATGHEEQVDNSLWVSVQFADKVGWVNRAYLTRQFGTLDAAMVAQATHTIQAIKAKEWQQLSMLIHPEKGVRFSPYTYLQPDDITLSRVHIQDIATDQTIYQWGYADGVGEPINLTFADYYDRFIYGVDFAQPEVIGLNKVVSRGNSINNIAETYPEAVFVEYHFSGFEPSLGGMDWRSLRLVFEQQAEEWYLVGIVHDQWTI